MPLAISAPCCANLPRVAKPECAPRAAEPSLDVTLPVGVLTFAALAEGAAAGVTPWIALRPRGQPPGERLHAFSSILRV